MPATEPTSSPPAAIHELLKQAAATVYCRPALRALAAMLPADNSILTAALHEAAMKREAKSFSHLYFAGLLAGRRIPAAVLESGSALLPEGIQIMHTALRLEGDVAESLTVAVRSGRMSIERDATAIAQGGSTTNAGKFPRRRNSSPSPARFVAGRCATRWILSAFF